MQRESEEEKELGRSILGEASLYECFTCFEEVEVI